MFYLSSGGVLLWKDRAHVHVIGRALLPQLEGSTRARRDGGFLRMYVGSSKRH